MDKLLELIRVYQTKLVKYNSPKLLNIETDTHTHTHTYIYSQIKILSLK